MVKFRPIDSLLRSGSNIGDVPTPPTVIDESFIRPIISKFIMVTIFWRSINGFSIKYFAPNNPFSSASNPKRIMLLFNRLFWETSFWANSKRPDVPDALSSAPICIPVVSGLREPVPAPPFPRWSKCAPITIYSFLYFRFPLWIRPTTLAARAWIGFNSTEALMVIDNFKETVFKDWFIVFWIFLRVHPTALNSSSAISFERWIAGIPAFEYPAMYFNGYISVSSTWDTYIIPMAPLSRATSIFLWSPECGVYKECWLFLSGPWRMTMTHFPATSTPL